MKQVTFELKDNIYKLPYELSIGNYVKIFKKKDLFDDEYFAAELISMLTGADFDDLMEASKDEIKFLSNELIKLIPVERPTFTDRFTLDGIEYGFIPEWKKMTFAEFADLDTLMTKKPMELLDYLHIVTAIMYRPIIQSKEKGNFKIEKYNQETLQDRAELFKNKLDIEVALGAQFFFILFAMNFLDFTQTSLVPKMTWIQEIGFLSRNLKKIWKLVSKKDLDGMSFSIELRMMILQDMMKSSIKQYYRSSTSYHILLRKIKKWLAGLKNNIKHNK
jgi:hypothetical protein